MADRRGNDRLFGTDLDVLVGPAAHDTSPLDLRIVRDVPRRPADGEGPADLARRSGRENLAQALILRLLTPRGSLASLGHAAYGSRLHELIGARKNDTTRHLCRAYVLEAIAAEPRIEPRAVAFAFDPAREGPSSFSFTVSVRPRAGDGDLPLSLELAL